MRMFSLDAPDSPRDHLPRLSPEHYRGHAVVNWIMATHDRRTGWLSAAVHAATRELLLHVLARDRLACPIYCLMPDHAHFLWMGLCASSDQRLAARRFRHHWEVLLAPVELQKQPFDHVLRPAERERGAFQSVVRYIRENPCRKGLVDTANAYPFSGVLVPGYPDISLTDSDFWDRFWRVYVAARQDVGTCNAHAAAASPEPPPPS